jgi:divalent metal cation (Fe/Co/Zn/Cd) transporter
MILFAALYINFESVRKWVGGLSPETLGFGSALTAAALVINGCLGAYLVWLGRRRNSIILVANGRHVLTDYWTRIGLKGSGGPGLTIDSTGRESHPNVPDT